MTPIHHDPPLLSPPWEGNQDVSSPPPATLSATDEQEMGEDHERDHQREGEQKPAVGVPWLPASDSANDYPSILKGAIVSSGSKGLIQKQAEGDHGDQKPNGSVKWMSSKARMMKKMAVGSDQGSPPAAREEDSSSNSPSNKIRVCSDCNTTKTPLWRSGPQGPKSLCNACGIRQRKARRAMAAAAAGGLQSVDATVKDNRKVMEEKRSGISDYSHIPYKKRCRLGGPRSRKRIRFEEFTISLSKNSSAFHQMFPQDEKEAAILLMALSCGLVRG